MPSVRFIVVWFLFISTIVHATTTVYFPAPEEPGDERSDYPLILLRLAFEKSHADYRVERTKTYMTQGRAVEQLQQGSGLVQVLVSMTSTEREAKLLPIRIPVYKGLIGWRIPLVPADNPDLLKNVHNRADLAKFLAGQGADWPDTEIMRANKLQVRGEVNYSLLFNMLGQHRFDYFPRSIVEIGPEARGHIGDKVVMDTHIIVHYPAAAYFFVNQHDIYLAELIQSGLEAAIKDGSFDRLFYSYHRQFLINADVKNRTIIELMNPLLPAVTPTQRKELWFRPVDMPP